MRVDKIGKMQKMAKDRILLRKQLEKEKNKMRERSSFGIFNVKNNRKMIGKKELPTSTEARENKKQICLIQVQRRMATSYYIISVYKKIQFLLFSYLPLPSFFCFVIKNTLFQRAMFVCLM